MCVEEGQAIFLSYIYLSLSSHGHWNSHLWAFLCVNPPRAARMPAAPCITPRPRHFDGYPTQSLIHRVLQPGSDLSSLCTICLLLPSLFRLTFFYAAFICFLSFSHIISPFGTPACWPSLGTVHVCMLAKQLQKTSAQRADKMWQLWIFLNGTDSWQMDTTHTM